MLRGRVEAAVGWPASNRTGQDGSSSDLPGGQERYQTLVKYGVFTIALPYLTLLPNGYIYLADLGEARGCFTNWLGHSKF